MLVTLFFHDLYQVVTKIDGTIWGWGNIISRYNVSPEHLTPIKMMDNVMMPSQPELFYDNLPIYNINYNLQKTITNEQTAKTAIESVSKTITSEEKANPDNIDAVVRFTEHAVENAEQITFNSNTITLNAELVNKYDIGISSFSNVATTSLKSNITPNRTVEKSLKINMPKGETVINVEKSFAQGNIDRVVIAIGDNELIFKKNRNK